MSIRQGNTAIALDNRLECDILEAIVRTNKPNSRLKLITGVHHALESCAKLLQPARIGTANLLQDAVRCNVTSPETLEDMPLETGAATKSIIGTHRVVVAAKAVEKCHLRGCLEDVDGIGAAAGWRDGLLGYTSRAVVAALSNIEAARGHAAVDGLRFRINK